MNAGKLIILDRDGVINHDSAAYIKSAAEWQPIDGSLAAIAALKRAGFAVVVVSNQSGVGRGLFGLEDLTAITHKMQQALLKLGGKVDKVYFCPHHPEQNCDCRKPKIGMYLQLSQDLNLNLRQIRPFSVGDSLRDLQAAHAAGCQPVLVKTGNGVKTVQQTLPPDCLIFDDLQDFVCQLLLGAGATGRA